MLAWPTAPSPLRGARRTMPLTSGPRGARPASGWRCPRRMTREERELEPRDIVQAAIDAYHDHDLDRCLGYYSPEVVVKDADGNVLMAGANAVRSRYAKSMLDHPNLHYDIPNRIALGEWVIDEERVTGFTKPGSPEVVRAVLVYRFSRELIREILILS